MPIKYLDMFAGIGGFRSGLERLGGFQCIGYCEIDKYAKQAYDAMYPTEGELYFADARTIDPYTLPDIDLICGGFPCQSFSIAGLRRGFQDDTRGTLFFEIARIAAVKRPPFLLLENVPGLLSHDKGRTFATILGALDELGYARMSVNYENEQRELVKRVDEDEKRLVSIEQTSLDLKILLKVLRSSTAFEELTPTLVNSLIRRIEVHNNDKSSGHCSVKVDIYFTAIGLIDIPTKDEIKSLMEKIQSNPQEYRLTA